MKGEKNKMEREEKEIKEYGIFRAIYNLSRGGTFRDKINICGGPISAYVLVAEGLYYCGGLRTDLTDAMAGAVGAMAGSAILFPFEFAIGTALGVVSAKFLH